MGGKLVAKPFLHPFFINITIHYKVIAMKQIMVITAILWIASTSLFGQNENQSVYVGEALRYSNLLPSGSTRFVGAGGAFAALGAEFANVSTNPAGIAAYTSNELSITPGLKFTNTDATLAGNSALDESKSAFNLDQIGIVFFTRPRNQRWRSFNVAIGMNKQNSFSQSIFYSGESEGTIVNNYFNEGESIINSGGTEEDFDPFGSFLAYDAGAIYFQDGNFSYDFLNNPNELIQREHSINTSGGINELTFAMASNYADRLMLGLTIGVPISNYRLEGQYSESDPDERVQYFDELTATEYVRTEGVGINVKFGLTYKVSKAFRLGAAFHTPTFFKLTENYYNIFEYTFTDLGVTSTLESRSPDGIFDYRLRTPWRAIFGGAVVLEKYGFLSADVELVDYSANRYDFTADVPDSDNRALEQEVNSDITREYRQAVNLRFGGEYVLDVFRLRAGLNLLGDPVEGSTGFRKIWSVGGGVRGKAGGVGEGFFIDMAYRRSSGEGSIRAYSGGPSASLDTRRGELLMTLGVRF